MISEIQKLSFENDGFLIIPKFENPSECQNILHELKKSIEENESTYSKAFDKGMIHNCFARGIHMLKHLELPALRLATDSLLCKHAIVYSYQSSSLAPGCSNYGSRIHVDCPRFIPNYRTNLGYILALQNFTKENGSTFVLPGSHKQEEEPSKEKFFENAIQIECEIGDAIFFDARVWHSAGHNKTENWRHSLTINFCRPYMRTRFDFPRMIENKNLKIQVNNSAMGFLGYHVRMPKSLEEFYVPEEQRLYKPGQE